MECPKCGAENAEHVAYCGKCGESVRDWPAEAKPSNAKPRFQMHGGPRRSVLTRFAFIVFFAFLLIRLIVYGGGVFDLAFPAIIIVLAIMPFLLSRRRKRQDSQRSAYYPKHVTVRNGKEPLKATLHSSLVRIEGNWIKRCQSTSGRLARLFRRGNQVIGFGTENERVTLTLSQDGRVTLTDGGFSKHDFDLDGPEEEMLVMLENARDIRSVPGTIRVRMRGRDVRPEVDYVVRDTVAKMLRMLFR